MIKIEVAEVDGFERRRNKKKQSIIQAAFELFVARGVKDVSTAEIAKKAGVSQASIYNFFLSKENLVREALFAFLDEQMRASEAVLNSNLPFQEKVEKLLFITDEATRQSSPEFFHSMITVDPMLQQFMEEYSLHQTDPFIMRLVEQGRAEGAINRELSDEAILVYIRALRETLAQPNISKKARMDLGVLFFYGLTGQRKNQDA